MRDELRPVVETHIVRRPMRERQTVQDVDDTGGVDGPMEHRP